MTTKTFTVFILDDEPWYGTLLQYHLSQNSNYTVERFENTASLLAELYRKPDAITVDFYMPDLNGLEAMDLIHNQLPEVPVIIISGQDEINTAVSLLRDGAFDYILKNDETTAHLTITLQHIMEIKSLKMQLEHLKNEVTRKYDFSSTVLGKSPGMIKVSELISKAILTNIPVSISGERGTGKELLAKTIHYNSLKNKAAFISVDLLAIAPEDVEGYLFGCEKGFDGNTTTTIGKIEEANNGTLFIKHINELSLHLQTKLLNFLEDKSISRVGGTSCIPLDVRLITATSADLKKAVSLRYFREDLYYKLLGLPIVVPALKDRGDDIILLSKVFIGEFCRRNNLPVKQLNVKARALLLQYNFPGNVRELKSLIDLAVVLSGDDNIDAKDINLQNSSVLNTAIEREKTLKEYEHEIVQHYLEKYEGNVLQVAEKLAIGKSTLYRMLKSNVLQQ
jgi:DNA-binding NtrC family response regulator